MNVTVRKAPQFVTDARGKPVGVLLSLKSYERLLEAEEELAEIEAYDAAKPQVMKELAAGDYLPLKEFLAQQRRA